MAMMVASFGYCVSDVAADGLTVQLAKKEEEARRGQTQTSVYLVRTCVEINHCVGCADNSSLSHFSAMTLPTWLGRAARNRHRHAIDATPNAP